jgi:hypothetical protein
VDLLHLIIHIIKAQTSTIPYYGRTIGEMKGKQVKVLGMAFEWRSLTNTHTLFLNTFHALGKHWNSIPRRNLISRTTPESFPQWQIIVATTLKSGVS